MKLLFLLLLLVGCSTNRKVVSDKEVENNPGKEEFYLFFADKLECGIPNINGVDVSPRSMLTAFPLCRVELKRNKAVDVYFLDCTSDPQIDNVLIYTKTLEECLKVREVLQQMKQHLDQEMNASEINL